MRLLNRRYEEDCPLSAIKPHPDNVNEGDVGAIIESVEANGFWGVIIANERTGYILAGKHRYLAAVNERAGCAPVMWVDVDAEEEIRIMLADNRTTRLGHDDTAQQANLLEGLAETERGLAGTGFDGDDLDAMRRDLEDLMRESAGGGSGEGSSSSAPRDNGRNADGSVWAICPECGAEFEAKPGKVQD